eukprot:1836929-Alexandrium_andersonii.AAC.1
MRACVHACVRASLAARLRADLQAGRPVPRSCACEATWLAAHERDAESWLQRKSRERRWWPTDASDWGVLKELTDFTAVTH